ncbi:hypothetical protein GCM10007862_29160 [Dyella lipolytica]|uniref:Energy transducer TonB n=1 Tax=Dyella lipolytica TaxID=1867835 RepID=A0ABW8IVG6_9GAMM|nr:energy transducer TonB [Dyella lipolytica]GLQ47865.1 hypothetical protein GCM10007862_29160 [Dyella lipolytica]
MSRIPRRFCLGLFALTTSIATTAALAQQMRMVSPESLSHYWILLTTDVDVDLPNSGVNLYTPGCVAVTYIIGSDGVPQQAKVAKMVPPSDLGPAAVGMVSHFRYGAYTDLSKKPTSGQKAASSKSLDVRQDTGDNRQQMPVSTYYVVPFNTPDDPAKRQAVTAACKLPGYS